MTLHRKKWLKFCKAIVVSFSIFSCAMVNADTYWDPPNDPAVWSDASNWDGGLPSASDDARFDASQVTDGTTCILDQTATVDRAVFWDNNIFTFADALDITIDGLDSNTLNVDRTVSLVANRKDVFVEFRDMNVNARDLDIWVGTIGQFTGESARLTLDDVHFVTEQGFRLHVNSFGNPDATLNIERSIFQTIDPNALSTIESASFLNTIDSLIIGNVLLEGGEWNVNGGTTIQGSIGNEGGSVKLNGADLAIDLGDENEGTFLGPFTGTGGLRFISGTSFMSGSNSFSGGLHLEGGKLWIFTGSNTGSISNTIFMSGGQMNTASETQTLVVPWQITGPDSKVRVNGDGGLILTNTLSGSGTLTKVETGGFLRLTGNNSDFDGEIAINEGELQAGINDSLGNNSRVTLGDNGSFVVQDNEYFGSLGGTGLLDLSMANAKLLDSTNRIFSGPIEGPVSSFLTRGGAGSTILTGDLSGFNGTLTTEDTAVMVLQDMAANTYPGTFEIGANTSGMIQALTDEVTSGPTVVNQGELELSSQMGQKISYSSDLINSSATVMKKGFGELELNGNMDSLAGNLRIINGTLTGNATVAADLSVEFDSNMSPSGSFETSGFFNLHQDATLNIDIAGTTPGTDFDRIVVGEAAHFDGNLNVNLDPMFQPQDGQEFLIVQIDTNSSTGSFNGMPEGAIVDQIGGVDLMISYVGGDGNDVVLTAIQSLLIGDVNMDGIVDLLDVEPFIALITSGDYLEEADTNYDGVVSLLDVASFVALLTGN